MFSEEKIRSQLSIATATCLREDFPEKWPEYLNGINQYFNGSNVSEISGGLHLLKLLCSRYK